MFGMAEDTSKDCEEAVLGSLLNARLGNIDDRFVFDRCREFGVTEATFSDEFRGKIYRTLMSHESRGLPVDLPALLNRFHNEEWFTRLGGDADIERFMKAAVVSTHVDYHIKLMKVFAKRREVVSFAHAAIDLVYKAPHPSHRELDGGASLLNEIEAKLYQLFPIKESTLGLADVVDRSRDKLIDLVHNGATAMDGLSTGYKLLDSVLFGLHGGEYVIIAARPSVGKTTLAMNIAEAVATGEYLNSTTHEKLPGGPRGVLVFSEEMDRDSLMKRMLTGMAGLKTWCARRNQLSPDEKADLEMKLREAADRIKAAPLYIVEGQTREIADIRSQARRMKRKYPEIGLIVVDYLQLLRGREYAQYGRQIEVGGISNELKSMACELNVPVIVLSQLSRDNVKDGRDPAISDLRDSGAIEQDADVVILLNRKRSLTKPYLVVADVAKHRNGETGPVQLAFWPDWTRFSESESDRKDAGINVEGDKPNAAGEMPPGQGEAIDLDKFDDMIM